MGTIASVLQWTCSSCRYINPTESLKCINCGNIRRIKVPAYLASPDDYDDEFDDVDSPNESTVNSTEQRNKTSKHSDQCDETLPGYVEINSNGYIILFRLFFMSTRLTILLVFTWFSAIFPFNLQMEMKLERNRFVPN